jgi:uncharacterized protein
MMELEWDETKRSLTLTHRGLDFSDANLVFEGRQLTLEDDRVEYGETRYQTIGRLRDRMVMVVWTPRGQARRIISMRECNDREQQRYAPHLDGSG